MKEKKAEKGSREYLCGLGFLIFYSVDREGHWEKWYLSNDLTAGREEAPVDVWEESITGR